MKCVMSESIKINMIFTGGVALTALERKVLQFIHKIVTIKTLKIYVFSL